jgi:hypothetical protein
MSNEQKIQTYFNYLDYLRESGETNMFGAVPYLKMEFGLCTKDAKNVLTAWMKTFTETE